SPAHAYKALISRSQNHFALFLSDTQMPVLVGTELLLKIVERYPDTAVIMISGVDRTQRVIDAIRVGASDYLVKPCELDVLTLCIERALGARFCATLAAIKKRWRTGMRNWREERLNLSVFRPR